MRDDDSYDEPVHGGCCFFNVEAVSGDDLILAGQACAVLATASRGRPLSRTRGPRWLRGSTEAGDGSLDDLHDGVGGEFGFSEERLAMPNGSGGQPAARGTAAVHPDASVR